MRVKIFTLIINVIAIQVDLFSPNVIGDAFNGSGLIVNKRECLKIGVTAQSQIFNVQIDTTIADTLLPSAELNDYNGPVITYEPSEASEPVSYTNDDYTSWEGYNTDIEIGLNQTTWKSSSPIIAIYAQSDDPKLLDNDAQGIMGISFTPPTDDFKLLNVMDMWVSQNFISKNEIAFHVCQQNSNSKSWVDFGNDTPFDECSKKNVSMTLPSLPTITLSILDISFGRLSIETLQKQTPFSPGYFGGANLDTCSSIIKIPDGVHENFLLALKDSSGFNDKISKDKGYEEFLKGNMALKANPSDIVYNSLPTITFTIATDADNIELTLGPYQYMRRVGEYYYIGIQGGAIIYATFGRPFFEAFHLILNRSTGLLTFQLGCDCALSKDQLPKIKTGDTVIIPISNSDTTSASASSLVTRTVGITSTTSSVTSPTSSPYVECIEEKDKRSFVESSAIRSGSITFPFVIGIIFYAIAF